MVNFEKMNAKSFKGHIIEVKELTLRDYLGEDKIEAFKEGMTKLPQSLKGATQKEKEEYKESRLDRTGLAITTQIDDEAKTTFMEFQTTPKLTGYNKSNIKIIIERNSLPYDSTQWVGKPVEVRLNDDGYWRLSA